MRTHLVVVPPRTPLEEAHRLLVQTGVRYLPVVEGERYLGLVGERQLRLPLAPWAPGHLRADPQAPVARFLQPFPQARPEEPLEEAAFRLEAARVGALPVVEGEALLGLVTAYDLLRGLLELLRPKAPATRLDLLVPDGPGLGRVLRAVEESGTPLVGLHLFREAGGLGFRVLLHVGALDVRPLLARLEALGLRPIRP
ncbi:CBS domain-containing protein [Thermus thermamylovorans]|nr:CBS domain-containing protein [Thermus thermamylovorans]